MFDVDVTYRLLLQEMEDSFKELHTMTRIITVAMNKYILPTVDSEYAKVELQVICVFDFFMIQLLMANKILK
jgi:hypothetical protein